MTLFRKSALLLGMLVSTGSLLATAYTVISPSDVGTGVGTTGDLRYVITQANADAGSSTIGFAIGTGPQTIHLLSALPSLSKTITIDGTTQPGFSGAPLIELDGTMASGSGIAIAAPNCTVRGLIVDNFPAAGVTISSSGTNSIVAGNVLVSNGLGVGLSGSNNIIGGSTAADRNVISGNSTVGIDVSASNNVIKGNYIGVNAAGTSAQPNGIVGLEIRNSASGTTVGGLGGFEGNVISGNLAQGIQVDAATGLRVWGNKFGSDATGTTQIPNGAEDIFIQGSTIDNMIGGTVPAARNLFMFNGLGSAAIAVINATATSNAILQNRMVATPPVASVAIDLGRDGATMNDAGDGDNGPNHLQNYPVIGGAGSDGANITINATLNGLPSTTFEIDFFWSSAAGRMGENVLGSVNTTTDGTGNASIFASFPAVVSVGSYVTATATLKPSMVAFTDTSEVSAAAMVTSCAPDVSSPGVDAPPAVTVTQTTCS